MDRHEIAAILSSAGLRPQHHFGQNFMVDERILQAIADAGEIEPEDVVLEVGPGVGNLTRQLALRASRGAVLAVDIDRKLMPAAQRHHAALTNVTWLNADVLSGKHKVEPAVLAALRQLKASHPAGTLKLVSNLPYNAASPLIAELLVEMWRELTKGQHDKTSPPLVFSRLVFTVQWEVALRMNAKPDTRDFGPLGILIQAMAGPGGVEIIRKIPAGAFWPPPKIQSALVVITPDLSRIAAISNALALQELLAGVFSHRRQTLANALKHHLGDRWTLELKSTLTDSGFDLAKRPETFAVTDFLRLADLLRKCLMDASTESP